jgi:hypothetical protein
MIQRVARGVHRHGQDLPRMRLGDFQYWAFTVIPALGLY